MAKSKKRERESGQEGDAETGREQGLYFGS